MPPEWKKRLEKKHPFRSGANSAICGALALGVCVPCILTWWHLNARMGTPSDLGFLLLIALIFCGPGALILSFILLAVLRRNKAVEDPNERKLLSIGIKHGAIISFLNFPGYIVLAMLHQDWLRFIALYLITGGSCGAWIAWRVFLEWHPERGWFPRFSLQTLVIMAFAWGILFFLFQPRQFNGPLF